MGALIGGVASITGVIIAQNQLAKRERDGRLLAKKEECYINTLRYLLKVLNRRSEITEKGTTILKKEDASYLLSDLSEVQIWLATLRIYCSPKLENKITVASNAFNSSMAAFLGYGGQNMVEVKEKVLKLESKGKYFDSDIFNKLIESVSFAYVQIIKCAKIELRKGNLVDVDYQTEGNWDDLGV